MDKPTTVTIQCKKINSPDDKPENLLPAVSFVLDSKIV